MFPKNTFLIVVGFLILAGLACGFGQTTAAPDAARQTIVAQIPGPYSGQPQADQTFVGEVEGSQTFIAFVIQNEAAVVYICDGGDVWEWFGGPVVNGKLDLSSEKGNHLIADVGVDSVTGTLALAGGQPLNFSAIPAVEGQTGLFRDVTTQDNVTYVTGWIFTATGARGETISPNGPQNGLNITISPDAGQQTILRIRSDDREYTVAHNGTGYNLHQYSVLDVVVNPGQNDFDYFCNDTKYFAGGIVVPQGNILTVDLVADGCQALPGPAAPSLPPAPAPEAPGLPFDLSDAFLGGGCRECEDERETGFDFGPAPTPAE